MDHKTEIEKRIGELQRLLVVIDKLPDCHEWYFNRFDDRFVVTVSSLDELTRTRHVLRERLGTWSDKLVHVWESLGNGLASYESDEWPIEIRLSMPRDQLPQELGGHCRFVPTPTVRYSYVCDAKLAGKAG